MQDRNGARELGLIVATLAVLGRFVAEMPLWATATLAVVVGASGTAGLLGESRPWRWPLNRVVLPALAAFAAIGTARLVDPVPGLAFAFVGSWLVVAWVVGLEIAASEVDGANARSTSARLGAFGLAFLGFAAVGGLVPAGLAGDGQPLTVAAFVATVVLDAAIGGLAGYRIEALRPHTRGDAVVAFYQYSMILALAGVAVRVLALPRLFGPAVLALATYLVTSLRESEEPVRFNARLLEETAVLAVAGALVIGVGLLAR